MPLLGTLIANLVVSFGTFIAGYIGARAALIVTALVTITTMTAALATTIQALLGGLVVAFPETNPVVHSLVWTALPANLPACIAACLSCDAFIAVYIWGRSYVNIAVKA